MYQYVDQTSSINILVVGEELQWEVNEVQQLLPQLDASYLLG